MVIENSQTEKQFKPKESSINLIYGSTIPWISFTGMKHARKGTESQTGIPKVVFEKLLELNNSRQLPFSVEVHHALMDGLHVAELIQKMQQEMDMLA